MDSITQAALGSLCGELTLRKQIGWKAVAWGFCFGTLPDLDILTYPWLDAVQRLGWHRGLSHSILVAVLTSIFFGWLLAKLHRKSGVSFKRASWFVFITWTTHVLIDCFTSYGTQIFEPFSNYRAALNNMSIIDIAFMLPILLGLFIVLFHDKHSRKRTWIGWSTALWLCFYTALSFTIKHQANTYFKNQLAQDGIHPQRMMTAPTLSNIFLWRMVAETDEHYHVSYWSIFDSPHRRPHRGQFPKGHQHLEKFHAFPETATLTWFAKDWHMIIPDPKDPNVVLFIDMRFTEMVTADQKSPIFAWILKADPNNPENLQFSHAALRKKTNPRETVRFLWQRILGKAPNWMQAPWVWEPKDQP